MKKLDPANQLIVRLVLLLFILASGVVSNTPIHAFTSDYHITTYSSKIDDEYENFIWMQDTRIDTTEPLKKELTVGINWNFKKLQERIETCFVPFNIMPYSTFLGEGAADGDNPITVQDVHAYFLAQSNNILLWLDEYKATLDSIRWSDPSLRQTRYRFYTEADTADNNGLNLEDPEPYIEFLHYFYPMFHSKLPDSTLVVGMCSVRNEYFYAMMKYFHETYPGASLPFDGVDFHFISPNIYSGSVDYNFIKSVFEEFGYGNEFGRMVFWAADATYAPRGFTPRTTFKESCTYGYYSQQEQTRHMIKSFASALALPGMLQVNQGKMFSEEWQPRTLDTIWDTNAHYGNGHSMYEIGLRTPYLLQTSLKWMNDALHDYRPAYNNKAGNLRVYDRSMLRVVD